MLNPSHGGAEQEPGSPAPGSPGVGPLGERGTPTWRGAALEAAAPGAPPRGDLEASRRPSDEGLLEDPAPPAPRAGGAVGVWTSLLGRLRGQSTFTGMDGRALEQVALITVSTILMSVCHTVLGPVLPVYAQQFELEQYGTLAAGATISVFAVGRLLANIPAGHLADTYGRKAMLVWGPALTAFGMLMSGYAGSYPALLFWRFFTGVGSSIQMTGSQLFLGDISQKSNRARVMGTNQAAALLGVSVGPALGGLLASAWSITAPFTVTAGLAALAAVYGHLRLPETHPGMQAPGGGDKGPAGPGAPGPGPGPGAPAPSRREVVWQLLASPPFLCIMAVNATLFMSANGGRAVLMPLYGTHALGWSMAEVGALFSAMAVVNMAGLLPASWAADKVGRAKIIVPGLGVMGLGLLLASQTSSPALFAAAMVVYAAGQTVSGSAPTAYAMDIMPEKARGAALGVYRSAGDVGLLLGPAVLGLVSDWASVQAGFVANGATLLACAAAFQVLSRSRGGQDHRSS